MRQNQRVMILTAAAVMLFTSARPCRVSAQPDDPQAKSSEKAVIETAGWLDSGRTLWLTDDGPRLRGPDNGTMEGFCTRKEIRAIACRGDTVWIGTEGGLFAWCASTDSLIFDSGPSFTSVNAVTIDDKGALWIGGDQGVSVRKAGRWIHYTSDFHPFFTRVTDFFPAEGRMWIATYGKGCGYVFADSIRIITRADSLLDDRVVSVVENSGAELWLGTASGLCRADSFRWQSMRYGSRIPIGQVEDLLPDEEGNLFIAIARRGAALYNIGRVKVFGVRQGLPSDNISEFVLDPTGRVWAAGSGGVSTYDGSGWVPYRAPEVNLSEYDFLSAACDEEGDVCLGTDKGRMLVLSRDAVRNVDIPQVFPARMISSIRQSPGAVWFLSDSGVYRLGSGITPVPLPDKWFEGEQTGMVIDGTGGMWVSTRFGILHYDSRKWEIFDRRQGLPTEYFTSVCDGPGDELWFGTFDSGVLRLARDRWVHYTAADGLPSERIAAVTRDGAGTIWAVTGNGDAASFKSGKWVDAGIPPQRDRTSLQNRIDTLATIDPGIQIMKGHGDPEREPYNAMGIAVSMSGDGDFMLARPDGIFIASDAGWQFLDLPDSRSGVIPSSLIKTSSGEIWLGTAGQGLYVRTGERWRRITANEGLTDDFIMSMAQDSSGRVWIGTRSGGITLYKPGK